jgi:hypothetical protein
MPKPIHLKKPCTARLEEMPRVEGGVFCTECQLKVNDFTGFTDSELTEWFADNAGKKACGIYNRGQVKIPFFRQLALPFRYAAITVLAFFAFKNTKAQSCSVPKLVETDSSKIISIHGDTVIKKFYGRVITTQGIPVAHVHIRAEYGGLALADALADVNGIFEILVPYKKDQLVTFHAMSFDKEGKLVVDGARPEPVEVKVKHRRRRLFHRRRVAGAYF